jgi:hypothetical protein
MRTGLPKDVKKIRQGLLIADCGFLNRIDSRHVIASEAISNR